MGILVELAVDGEGGVEEGGILGLRDVLHTAGEEWRGGVRAIVSVMCEECTW